MTKKSPLKPFHRNRILFLVVLLLLLTLMAAPLFQLGNTAVHSEVYLMYIGGSAFWNHYSAPWFSIFTRTQEYLYLALLIMAISALLGPQRWYRCIALFMLSATSCLGVAALIFALNEGDVIPNLGFIPLNIILGLLALVILSPKRKMKVRNRSYLS